jgi:membrane protease YdiL (CAAX protease family)
MWADIARVTLMVVALDVLGGTAMHAVAVPVDLPEDVPDDALRSALFAPMLVTRVIAVILSVSVILRHRGQTLESVGLASAKWKMNLLVGIGATAVAYGFIFAWQMTMWYVWPGLLDQMNENADRIMALVPKPSHPIGFVLPALTVGIYEELLFRGFLLTRLRRGTGGWVAAVVISTAVFTSLHAIDQTPAALVPVAVLSVVFSLVTIWRRSLIPAIAGHFLFNLFNMIGLYYIAGDSWT